MVEPSDKYIYKKNKTNNFIIIEETLNKLTSAEKKLEYMLTKMNQENKNRFSIYWNNIIFCHYNFVKKKYKFNHKILYSGEE